MTESLRLEIAQNLTLIVDMCSRLEEQAAVDALRSGGLRQMEIAA